ncbi:MAG: DUF2085 domain-containing protein [Armatimonadetes bacterium]|nr:DUF2085 domain-containing protein [Armatimonadota bacterium]
MSTRVSRNMVRLGDGLARFLVDHWLFLINGALLLVVSASLSAPCLTQSGHPYLASLAYKGFSSICHQKPERSLLFLGAPMAVCARCFAVYASLLGTGLLFTFLRRLWRNQLPRISLRLPALAALPLIVDAGTQLTGLRESTQALRIITGGLAGAGAGILVLFFLERAFREARDSVTETQ